MKTRDFLSIGPDFVRIFFQWKYVMCFNFVEIIILFIEVEFVCISTVTVFIAYLCIIFINVPMLFVANGVTLGIVIYLYGLILLMLVAIPRYYS